MLQCWQCEGFKTHLEFSDKAVERPGTCFCVCRDCRNETSRYYRSKPAFRARERARSLAAKRARTPEQRARDKAVANEGRRVRHWASDLAARACQNDRRLGREADVDEAFVLQLFEQQEGRCYWLGVPLRPSVEVRAPDRPSLDRLDCSKGHTKDNVVLVCKFANIGRQDVPADRFQDFLKQAGLRPAQYE